METLLTYFGLIVFSISVILLGYELNRKAMRKQMQEYVEPELSFPAGDEPGEKLLYFEKIYQKNRPSDHTGFRGTSGTNGGLG